MYQPELNECDEAAWDEKNHRQTLFADNRRPLSAGGFYERKRVIK
jgi:hypothetical protein